MSVASRNQSGCLFLARPKQSSAASTMHFFRSSWHRVCWNSSLRSLPLRECTAKGIHCTELQESRSSFIGTCHTMFSSHLPPPITITLSFPYTCVDVPQHHQNVPSWHMVYCIVEVIKNLAFTPRGAFAVGAHADTTDMCVLLVSLEPPGRLRPLLTTFSRAVTTRELTASQVSPAFFQAIVACLSSRKRVEYEDLLAMCTTSHHRVCLTTIEVGSRGFINAASLNKLYGHLTPSTKKKRHEFEKDHEKVHHALP